MSTAICCCGFRVWACTGSASKAAHASAIVVAVRTEGRIIVSPLSLNARWARSPPSTTARANDSTSDPGEAGTRQPSAPPAARHDGGGKQDDDDADQLAVDQGADKPHFARLHDWHLPRFYRLAPGQEFYRRHDRQDGN